MIQNFVFVLFFLNSNFLIPNGLINFMTIWLRKNLTGHIILNLIFEKKHKKIRSIAFGLLLLL
ncbi:hypothetical protein BpHYR1_036762 [Brachionus plicatilis]|uniref:Uncharacterized protein n=1 Tax=Brachionus plicatilis TaxID=10195 RepID=A0A3M7QKA1_BRAPC|nr:hypothetical protein BpHYR1_036762 [Brachionus plicatilis]